MSYRKHFQKEHISTVKDEVACIVDLCGKIALNTKKLNIEEANRFMEDLEKSWQVILDLHNIKKSEDENISEEAGRWF